MSEPTPAVDAIAAYNRLIASCDKAFAASEEIDAQGGMAELARVMTPKALDRAAVALKSAREVLDAQLLALKQARRGKR